MSSTNCPHCGKSVEATAGKGTLREVTAAWSRERDVLLREIDGLRARVATLEAGPVAVRAPRDSRWDISVASGLRGL